MVFISIFKKISKQSVLLLYDILYKRTKPIIVWFLKMFNFNTTLDATFYLFQISFCGKWCHFYIWHKFWVMPLHWFVVFAAVWTGPECIAGGGLERAVCAECCTVVPPSGWRSSHLCYVKTLPLLPVVLFTPPPSLALSTYPPQLLFLQVGSFIC